VLVIHKTFRDWKLII